MDYNNPFDVIQHVKHARFVSDQGKYNLVFDFLVWEKDKSPVLTNMFLQILIQQGRLNEIYQLTMWELMKKHNLVIISRLKDGTIIDVYQNKS